jgi:hypothetical protein
MVTGKRRDWREARSSLRLLLHYPQLTSSVGFFKRIPFRGTDYIYNERASNVIATIRPNNHKGWLVRYRPTSYYADILVDYAKSFGPHAVAIPSHNLSRQERRMRRFIGNIRSHIREQMIQRLWNESAISKPFDAITMDRRTLRTRAQEAHRISRILANIDPNSPRMNPAYNFSAMTTTSGTTLTEANMRSMMDRLNEVTQSEPIRPFETFGYYAEEDEGLWDRSVNNG